MKIVCGTKSRPCELVVALSIFVLSCAAAQAQPQSHRAVSRPMPGPPHGPPAGQGAGSARGPAGQSSRERWLAMPPEARQNFRRNAERWMQMSPEERNVMRQRIEAERQKELPALIQQLKKEFQIDQPVRSPATKPAESANPKK